MLTESWVEGKNVEERDAHPTMRTAALWELSSKIDWTEPGVKASRATTHRRVKEFGYSCRQRGLPELRRRRTGLLPSGPKSSFQMRASFVFHLETKVLESGGRVEKLIAQVAWSPVLSFPGLWWFGVQCHLLVLVHCVFWKPTSLHPFIEINLYIGLPIFFPIFRHITIIGYRFWKKMITDIIIFFLICHIHNYTEYNQQWNVFSEFNPSKHTHSSEHTHTHTHTHTLGAVGAHTHTHTHTHTHLELWAHTHKWETRDQNMQMSWRPLSKKPGRPYHLSSSTNWSPSSCHTELRK